MKEDYVNFEIAKLLKDKGFDWGCYKVYNTEGVVSISTVIEDVPTNYKNREYYFLCPTQQMTMKWLREKYKLNIIISIDDLDWFYSIIDYTHKGDVKMLNDLAGFNSYESACEAGIKYCLENLI